MSNTDDTTPQNTFNPFTQSSAERLNALFWRVYKLETYVGIAYAAADEKIPEIYTPTDEVMKVMAEHIHESVGAMISELDELANELGFTFGREGIVMKVPSEEAQS